MSAHCTGVLVCICMHVTSYRNNYEGVLDTGSNFWISAKQRVRRIKCMGEGDRGREGRESMGGREGRERKREREQERGEGERGGPKRGGGTTQWSR